jgi:hypothetical protein
MRNRVLAIVLLLVLLLAVLATTQLGRSPLPAASSQPTSSSVTTISTFTSSSASTQTSSQPVFPPQIKHVIIVVMENEGYGSVIGSPEAPYENSLASTYALAADYFAASHPSLPNYFALIAGDTLGVSSDCAPSQCPQQGPTIASLLDSKGLSWRAYEESMTGNCSQANSQDGLYVVRHDPFAYFTGITGDRGSGSTSAYCNSHVVPFSQFSLDLASSGLPSLSFITPNVCDDAHSCPLASGDQWLSTVVPKIINSTSFASTALFIVYDEGSNNSGFGPNAGGQVACILVSPFARPGYISHTPYSHYSLLATVEGILGTGNLGRNDATATQMSDLFSAPA